MGQWYITARGEFCCAAIQDAAKTKITNVAMAIVLTSVSTGIPSETQQLTLIFVCCQQNFPGGRNKSPVRQMPEQAAKF
jgi:hypothetical protein